MSLLRRRGLLAEPRRTAGGFRDYDADALRRLRALRRAQTLGFTLDEAAGRIETAVEQVLAAGEHVPADLGGSARCSEMTTAILRALGA